jgi:hypothetical protein
MNIDENWIAREKREIQVNQTKSNQIKPNQTKSNQIKPNQTKGLTAKNAKNARMDDGKIDSTSRPSLSYPASREIRPNQTKSNRKNY